MTWTGEGNRLPSVATTVIGLGVPLLSLKLNVQMRAGPLLSILKRYLRDFTWKNGWMAPLTQNLSVPPGTASGAVANIEPSAQNNLSVKFSGISKIPYGPGNRNAGPWPGNSNPVSMLS